MLDRQVGFKHYRGQSATLLPSSCVVRKTGDYEPGLLGVLLVGQIRTRRLWSQFGVSICEVACTGLAGLAVV